jgi:hypothetical protein
MAGGGKSPCPTLGTWSMPESGDNCPKFVGNGEMGIWRGGQLTLSQPGYIVHASIRAKRPKFVRKGEMGKMAGDRSPCPSPDT